MILPHVWKPELYYCLPVVGSWRRKGYLLKGIIQLISVYIGWSVYISRVNDFSVKNCSKSKAHEKWLGVEDAWLQIPQVIVRSFKKCCISNAIDGTMRMMPILKNNFDDHHDTDKFHPDIPTEVCNFKELFENSDNNLDSKRWLGIF